MMVWKKIEKFIFEIHPDFIFDESTKPLYSNKGWQDKYKHFVYKKSKNKVPIIPT